MNQKTALVTGASVGIGRATAIALSGAGYQLILLARREDKLLALQQQLNTACHIIACDVNDRQALQSAIESLPERFKNIDLSVNNAGLALGLESADQAVWDNWQTMIETNCMALAFLTRLVLPNMVERNKGHIINIGSAAGSFAYKGGNVYGASKAFVDHFTMNLRADLIGKKVRVTNLAPGLVGDTEFSYVRFNDDAEKAEAFYENCDALTPEDVANSVLWVASQPEHVNVNRLEIMPTCQAPAGLVVDKTMQ